MENICDLKLSYSEYKNAVLRGSRYRSNNNLALFAVEEDGSPILTASVNTDVKLPDTQIAIKDYSENTGVAQSLINGGFICSEPVGFISSGFVTIPVFNLTEKGLAIFEGV